MITPRTADAGLLENFHPNPKTISDSYYEKISTVSSIEISLFIAYMDNLLTFASKRSSSLSSSRC